MMEHQLAMNKETIPADISHEAKTINNDFNNTQKGNENQRNASLLTNKNINDHDNNNDQRHTNNN